MRDQRGVICTGLILAVLATTGASRGSAAPQRGPYVGDIDRSVDPCTDFFAYANGAWRAAHPIPQSMTRWSRRWEAGETSKERLKAILEEIAAKKDWAAGSLERQLADDYAACMDQSAIDALGVTPILPLLDAIDGMKGPAD